MTHILKPRLFECHDMWHRHEAPQTQCDTSWVNERPRLWGFVSPVATPTPQPLHLYWTRRERNRLGWRGPGWEGRKRRRRVDSTWEIVDSGLEMGCSAGNRLSKKTVWENERNKDWEQIDRGRERGTGRSWDWLLTLDLALWRAAMPCCSKELSPLALSLSAFSLLPLPLLTSDFPKRLRGRRGGADGRQSSHNHTI